MKRRKPFILIILALVLSPMFLSAQIGRYEDVSYWEITLSGGTSVFLGDVSYRPFSFSQMDWKPALGGSFARRFTALLGGRGTILVGQFAGEQKNKARRMEGNYFEITANGLVYLDNIFGEPRIDRLIQPYFLIGIGVIGYTTTRYSTVPTENPKLNRDNVEGTSLFGLGIDFRISSQWTIGIESTQHMANSDLLDSWSGHSWKPHRKYDFSHDTYNISFINVKYRFGGYFNTIRRGNYIKKVTKRKLKKAF